MVKNAKSKTAGRPRTRKPTAKSSRKPRKRRGPNSKVNPNGNSQMGHKPIEIFVSVLFPTIFRKPVYNIYRRGLPERLSPEVIDQLESLEEHRSMVERAAASGLPPLKMTKAAYDSIMGDLVQKPFRHEQGGILLGPEDSEELVVRYVRDNNGQATSASFTIDHDSLNKMIREVRPAKLACVGIVHSHPDGIASPSPGDIRFLERLFSNPKNGQGSSYFHFPIVCNGKLHPYVVQTNNVHKISPTRLVIV